MITPDRPAPLVLYTDEIQELFASHVWEPAPDAVLDPPTGTNLPTPPAAEPVTLISHPILNRPTTPVPVRRRRSHPVDFLPPVALAVAVIVAVWLNGGHL
jgi:hypothetical protein